MPDTHVSNLKAAVELAQQWRDDGTHSWFRGQNGLWPLATSLGRRQANPEALAHSKHRLQQFCDWLIGVPELKHLLEEEHVHSLFAILQHYGLPTHYMDFTVNPKVAGFFAGVGPDAKLGQEGCIIAIDPEDWVRRLRIVAEVQGWPAAAWPEQVIVHVPNLWRLDAQSGHFVYLPVEKAERHVPVDRIVFTHDGSGFELSANDVYPSRKSPLEERLDEFFTEELMRSNQETFQEMARAWTEGGQGFWVNYERPESRQWLRTGVEAHESWRSLAAGWTAYVHEKHRDTRDAMTAAIPLIAQDPLQQRKDLRLVVRRLLAENQGMREKVVGWQIRPAIRTTPSGWISFVERGVQRTWEGVRRLPFTDDQVAESVVMTVVLASADISQTPSFTAPDFSTVLGPVLHMELANGRDTTARAAMAETTYEGALRRDIEDVILPELLDRPRQQLRQVLAPAHLFDFNRLVDAFASELIPTQVLIQSQDLAVFYSPVRTPVIGAA